MKCMEKNKKTPITKSLFFFVILVLILATSLLIVNILYTRECKATEFKLHFQCPRNTSVRYWPDIYGTNVITITTSPIIDNQATDNVLYSRGITIIQRPLDKKYSITTTAKELVVREQELEDKRISEGKLPQTPGPYKIISPSASDFQKLPNTITAESVSRQIYVNVNNGNVYEILINKNIDFSEKDLKTIINSMSWELSK